MCPVFCGQAGVCECVGDLLAERVAWPAGKRRPPGGFSWMFVCFC